MQDFLISSLTEITFYLLDPDTTQDFTLIVNENLQLGKTANDDFKCVHNNLKVSKKSSIQINIFIVNKVLKQ